MAKLLCTVATALVLVAGGSRTVDKPHHHHHHHHKKTSKVHVQAVPPTPEEQSLYDAKNAREAAVSAKAAAGVAEKVAAHSVTIHQKAQEALGNAKNALHLARADVSSLTKDQEEALHKAEAKLSMETKAEVQADYRAELESKLGRTKVNATSEVTEMRTVLRELREELARRRASGEAEEADAAVDQELKELEGMLKQLEADEAQGKGNAAAHAELKAQIERLRELIIKTDGEAQTQKATVQEEERGETKFSYHVPKANSNDKTVKISYTIPSANAGDDDEEPASAPQQAQPAQQMQASQDEQGDAQIESTSSGKQSGNLDIDTEMPYGELEPFGREDTAQELTESSVRESDEMVDQLERAEVAEEKRAVFRALTRLRGAAITSFDGVARSQTGNIDEYNKVHQWRKTHPLHHLADEESDISKWAFPDNADF